MKRQKAKGKGQKFRFAKCAPPIAPYAFLTFAFCLLPFDLFLCASCI
jgi:hypothetical protein